MLTRGQLSALVCAAQMFTQLDRQFGTERVHCQAVQTVLFLGCPLGSQGFFFNPCSGAACSCCASHIADPSGFPRPRSWAKTGQQQPLGAQWPGTHCFSTSQTPHPCTRGAQMEQPSWSHGVSWGSVGQSHIFHAEDLKGSAPLLVSNGFTP